MLLIRISDLPPGLTTVRGEVYPQGLMVHAGSGGQHQVAILLAEEAQIAAVIAHLFPLLPQEVPAVAALQGGAPPGLPAILAQKDADRCLRQEHGDIVPVEAHPLPCRQFLPENGGLLPGGRGGENLPDSAAPGRSGAESQRQDHGGGQKDRTPGKALPPLSGRLRQVKDHCLLLLRGKAKTFHRLPVSSQLLHSYPSSRNSRSLARPRARRVCTVPSGRPRISPISAVW